MPLLDMMLLPHRVSVLPPSFAEARCRQGGGAEGEGGADGVHMTEEDRREAANAKVSHRCQPSARSFELNCTHGRPVEGKSPAGPDQRCCLARSRRTTEPSAGSWRMRPGRGTLGSGRRAGAGGGGTGRGQLGRLG